MSDVRMGLKHVILQRMQKSNARMIKSEQKQPTDFSIKRILEGMPSNKDITKTCSDILDLSKTGSNIENQGYTVSSNQYFDSSEVCQSLPGGDRCHSRQPVFSDFVVKPKVLKFWEHGSFDSNCNGCELYFKNINYPPVFYGNNNSWTKGDFSSQGAGLIQNFVRKSVNVNLINSQITDDEISYKCQTCDKVFGCATTLQSHEKTHKSPRYECTDCGKGFSQLRNYKYHLSVHRGTKEFAAECPECGKIFNDKGYLSSHMKIHRNKKEYECPYCPKSFNQRVAFNMHVRIHTGVKPHKCSECGKRFSRKMLLKQHMRTHSGEKPYQCSVCGKSFADRSNMTLHHRLHSGIKPFSCPICPKAFTKKHHLKTHLNYHTGCKPYVCPHPNCNQAFTQSSNMRTHAKKCQFRPSEIYSTLSPSL